MLTLRGPECLGQPPPRKAKSARLAVFYKIGNVFSFSYSQMTAQQFRQLDVYCRHLYFMKIGHEINCCVFKSRECSDAFRMDGVKVQMEQLKVDADKIEESVEKL